MTGEHPPACHDRVRKGKPVRYLVVAEAYRDLQQVSSRLALTERLAALLAQTPARYLLRLVTRNLRLGIGTPTIARPGTWV